MLLKKKLCVFMRLGVIIFKVRKLYIIVGMFVKIFRIGFKIECI